MSEIIPQTYAKTFTKINSAQIVVPCANFNESLEFFTEHLGFRVDIIFPADDPSIAVISGYGATLRLETSNETMPLTLKLFGDYAALTEREIYSPDGVRVIFVDEPSRVEIPEGVQEFVLSKFEDESSWNKGRAGMLYRDLIPSRLGGRFVASHISIPEGGEIPDYVHYHKIRFQMIYCISGWAKLVYEDQGAPFIMNAGDCVLQPPEIRHRVLESSAKFEVLEIGCPAVHETFADHTLDLPNANVAPERVFGAQLFVHHDNKNAVWKTSNIQGFEVRETGINNATNGLADVQTLRSIDNVNCSVNHSGEFLFFFILKGRLQLSGQAGTSPLNAGSSFVLPSGAEYFIEAEKGLEIIKINLPAE